MMAKCRSTIQYPGADGLPLTANLNHALHQTLIDSEAQILLLLTAGKARTEIAADVGADEAAVKEHVKAILRKAVGALSQSRGPKRLICLGPDVSCPVAEH
jgi:DNA-binding CsgD family transcriptional regulator